MIDFKILLAFAKDVVGCMTYFYKDRWIIPPSKVKSPFVHVMGEAIIRFSLQNREWLNRVAEEVVYLLDEDPEGFFEFGYELADELFQNEPFMELIALCSFITYIAHILFNVGNSQIMDHAYFMIAILFLKTRKRFEANGSWKEFQKLCLKFAMRVIKEGKAKQQNLTYEVSQSFKINDNRSIGNHNFIHVSKQLTIRRSKSADSVLRSHGFQAKPTMTFRKFIETVSKSTTVIAELSEETSKSTPTILKFVESMPKLTDDFSKSNDYLPKSNGLVSKPTDPMNKTNGDIQNPTKALSKFTDIKLKSSGLVSKPTGDMDELNGEIPKSSKSTGTKPKSTGASSKNTGPVSKPNRSIKKSNAVSQKRNRAIPKSIEAILKSSWDVPKRTISSKNKSDTPLQKMRTFPTPPSNLILVQAHLINKVPKDVRLKLNEKTLDSSNATSSSSGSSTVSK